jgi:multidrug efflux system membrane fusion protein
MPPDPPPPSPVPEAPARGAASRRRAVVGTLIALLVVVGIGWLAWSLTQAPTTTNAKGPPAGSGGARSPPATTVGVATADATDLPVILEALGTVTPTATSTVRPRVSGVLRDVLFREGQMVKPGQLLAQLDPAPFEMQLMQATGQRMRDEAQLENARLTLERFRQLLALDSIARQEVDTQAALVKQLEAAVMTSRAVEGTARLNVGYTRITAPIGGRVGLRVVDPGNLVNSNDAEGIAVITQLAPIDVEFAIPQDRIGELQARANTASRLPVEALDRTRTDVLDTGAFLSLDNQVDVQTGTVRAKARFQNARGTLFPSQFVNVRLLLRTIERAVTVPVAALRHGSHGDFVYVLDRETRTVALRPVERGLATAERVQIVKGLSVGETVITEGADRLKDGARVTLPGDAPPRAPRTDAGRGGTRGPAESGPARREDQVREDAPRPRSDARDRAGAAREPASGTAAAAAR